MTRRIPRPTRRGTLAGLGALALSGPQALAEPVLRAPIPRGAPKKGGRLVLGIDTARADETLDPTRLADTGQFVRALQIGSTLVRLGPDLGPGPDLALEWETDAEATTWMFRLRNDATFHDGRRFTARDAVHSLNLHRGPGSLSRLAPRLQAIEEIEADGPEVLRIRLSRPDGDLPVHLADPRAIMVPEGFTDWGRLIGTGPFRLVSFTPGVEMVAERFADHHLGGGHVESCVTLSLPEAEGRLAALAGGQVHYVTGLSAAQAAGLPAGTRPAAAPGGAHPVFVMRSVTGSLLADPDLRAALKALCDRQGMVRDVYRGFARPGADMPFPPGTRWACEGIEAPPRDLDRARFHLERTGLIRPVLMLQTSVAAGGPEAPALARHLAASAAEIGLEIKIEEVPPGDYWSLAWRQAPFHMSHWLPFPTAQETLERVHRSDSRWNESGWGNAALDALIDTAGRMPDGPERDAIRCTIETRIAAEGGSLIPLFADWIDGRSERLRGWRGHPAGPAEGWRIAEAVWFADAGRPPIPDPRPEP